MVLWFGYYRAPEDVVIMAPRDYEELSIEKKEIKSKENCPAYTG